MSNLSDKDIDRLSRDAADFYEPDHSSLSWTKLEQKLVEQIPERPPDGLRFGRINPYVWGSAIILITGISFFAIKNIYYSQHSTRPGQPIVQNFSPSSSDIKASNVTANHSDSVSSMHITDALNKKNKDLQKQNDALAHAGLGSGLGDEKNSDAGNDTYITRSAKNKNHITGSKRNQVGNGTGTNNENLIGLAASESLASNGSGAKNTSNVKTEKNNNTLEISNSANTISIPNGSDDKSNAQRVRNQLSLPSVVSSTAVPGHVTGNDSLLNQLSQGKAPVPYKALRINRSLNFGLTFGPDYTDAGGISNDQLGNNIGLTVGYYLTNKLSVNSGMIYTNKFYWAPGNSTGRTANTGMAAAPPPIEYINGSANMWELPLTLRYDFAKNEKTKFFVNAGFSSYFMMKQTYIYFFHNGLRPLAYKIEDNEQVNYWFKVANISLGFESDMGKGFSFQAEPFFKLPLTKMGIDNLKLNSYGFLLSFRYSPILNRTKK
jgi:hypothetical protein